jgi:hypothetical protein
MEPSAAAADATEPSAAPAEKEPSTASAEAMEPSAAPPDAAEALAQCTVLEEFLKKAVTELRQEAAETKEAAKEAEEKKAATLARAAKEAKEAEERQAKERKGSAARSCKPRSKPSVEVIRQPCRRCNGQGSKGLFRAEGFGLMKRHCPHCNGTGWCDLVVDHRKGFFDGSLSAVSTRSSLGAECSVVTVDSGGSSR